MSEHHSPKFAAKLARQPHRDKGAPPHHLRCDWIKDAARCLLADKHPGPHKYPTPEEP